MHSHVAQVATCPELIKLDEMSSDSGPHAELGQKPRSKDDTCRTPSTTLLDHAAETATSVRVETIASFENTASQRSTPTTPTTLAAPVAEEPEKAPTASPLQPPPVEALMRLPSEKEKEKLTPPAKLKHPAQVETSAELVDILSSLDALGKDGQPRRVSNSSAGPGPLAAEANPQGSQVVAKTSSGERRNALKKAQQQSWLSQNSESSPGGPAQTQKADKLAVTHVNSNRTTTTERARMIGARSPPRRDNWTHEREAPVRGLENLQRSLNRELFETRELVSRDKSSRGSRSGAEASTNMLRWPLPSERKALKRYFQRSRSKEDASRNFSDLKSGGGGQKSCRRSAKSHSSNSKQSSGNISDGDMDLHDPPEEPPLHASTGTVSVTLAPPMPSSLSLPSLTRQVTPSASVTPKCVPSAKTLRRQHEIMITKGLQDADMPSERPDHQNMRLRDVVLDKAVQLLVTLPKIVGALPWNSHKLRWTSIVYQHALALAAALATAACGRQAFEEFDAGQEMALSPCVDLIVAAGAFLALLACVIFWQRQALVEAVKLITNAARRDGVSKQWQRESAGDHCVNLALWIAAVTVRYFNSPDLHCALFAFSTLLLTGMVCTIIYSCRCLAKLVDNFCYRMVESPNYVEAMQDWNVFQALCRTMCGSLQFCFLSIQATATMIALLAIAEVHRGFRGFTEMLPGLLVAVTVTRIALWGATVTDKCARVPMLVNSVSADAADLDRDRMYVVEYIVQSQAGFYMFEVRVTSSTVLKTLYVTGAVAFGLASQLL